MNRLHRLKLILNPFTNPLAAMVYIYVGGLLYVERVGHQVIPTFLAIISNSSLFMLLALFLLPVFGDLNGPIASCEYIFTVSAHWLIPSGLTHSIVGVMWLFVTLVSYDEGIHVESHIASMNRV